MLSGIEAVVVFVRDLRQSRDWYELAFQQPPVEDSPDFVRFQIGSVSFCLHGADEKSPCSTGGCVAYWSVSDLDAAVARFISIGGRIYRGPIDTPDRKHVCQIIDPFGNVLGLVAGR